MSGKAWGIKLGSGRICVPFCERHEIVGLGWADVNHEIVTTGTREELWQHLRQVYPPPTTVRFIGSSAGQLYRFARECSEGDYVLYYDPGKKQVRICRVLSGVLRRDFDTQEDVDIWFYRRVDYPVPAIPILDFYGGLKGSLLGPRMSFWSLGLFEKVDQLAHGQSPHLVAASDPEIEAAYEALRELLVRRAEALDAKDWELMVVDYLKEQGARVDEQRVGKDMIIDVEARFDHGELPAELWRAQVKRYQSGKVDWPEIEEDLKHVGDQASFLYVSVFGFTDDARRKAVEERVILLEAGDFTRFLLGGKMRERLRERLRLPFEV